MLFKDYVYLDNNAVDKYSNQLSGKAGKRGVKINKIASSIKAGVGPVSAQADFDGQVVVDNDPLSRVDAFERELEEDGGDSYFDALTDDTDLSTLPPMSIVKLMCSIEIPEAFDMLALTQRLLPFLVESGIAEPRDNPAAELTLELLGKSSADVPVIADLGGLTLSGKLKTGSIVSGSVDSIEELEGEDAIVLCKVISYSYGEEVIAYDPLKDFMNLGRAMRRQMARGEGLEPIFVEGPVLKVEVIAIYR